MIADMTTASKLKMARAVLGIEGFACEYCRHWRTRGTLTSIDHGCNHPNNKKSFFILWAKTLRGNEDMCGKRGRWFEP